MTAPAAPVSPPTQAVAVTTAPAVSLRRATTPAALVLALFAVLLSSFPARNLDLWAHLSAGRDVFTAGRFDPTWLFDAAAYLIASAVGAGGLVAVKAVACGAVAVLLFRLSAVSGWRVAFAVTGLTVLAMGTRLLVQPETVSVVCLAVAVWLTYRHSPARPSVWPGWPLVLLFVVWANADTRAVVGLAVVALARLGQLLDARGRQPFWPAVGRWLGGVGILTAAACASPSHVTALTVPAEVRDGWKAVSTPSPDALAVHSPFDPDYVAQFQVNSSALSYYPLLALGLLSVLLNRKGWRWGWVLPWVGLAVVSGLQARAIPLFAVVAGPVTAWNLQAVLARRPSPPARPRTRQAGLIAGGLIVAAFLVAAWPGWLQGPPYEPRRWAADGPPAAERGAEFLARAAAAGVWPADSRTLYLSPDTRGMVRWHYPQDDGLYDPDLVAALLTPGQEEDARRQLRERKVSRVVVSHAEPGGAAKLALDRLLSAPSEWRVLSLAGGLVVFGWSDPERPADPDPYARWVVDYDRLGLRPDESERPPQERPEPHWWEVFWTPAPPTRPAGRDEAAVLLRQADAMIGTSTERNLTDWEAAQLAGLVGAGAGWVGPASGGDAALRLTLFRPADTRDGVRPPPQTELVFALQQRFANDRGPIPVGVVYAAVRAARRAVAENPTDPQSLLILAQAYATLNGTCELGWGRRLTQLQRVRQVQQAAALNRAVALDPRLARGHLELYRLYRGTGCLDLAVEHLRAYKSLPPRWGGPPKTGDAAKSLDAELEQLTRQLASRTEQYEADTAKVSVSERALRAVQLELGGKALDLLLKSDVSAFGAKGVELEVDLLLRTGRPKDVLEWLSEEVGGSLGEGNYHWSRAQAFLALGDYDAADGELRLMVGPDGRQISPRAAAEEMAEAVGKGVLDGQTGGTSFGHLVMLALAQSDLQGRVMEASRSLGLEANKITLRGVMGLEAGEPDRAAAAFRDALALTPSRWAGGGQLEFSGRAVASDGLSLLGER
jgi:hypothetical protein